MKAKQILMGSILVLFLLSLLAGCGGGNVVEISGIVKYDGQPVPEGRITFLTQDGKGQTVAAVIAEGKYSVKVVPGSCLVQIEGFKIVGRQPLHPNDPSSPKVNVTEPLIPAEYNEKSKLKEEILASTRVLNFDLKKPANGA